MKSITAKLILLILVAGVLGSFGLAGAIAQSQVGTDELYIRIGIDGRVSYIWPNETEYTLKKPPIAVVYPTYSLIGDVDSIIVVEKNHIVLNGSGYTVNVSDHDGFDGIRLFDRQNVTVCNFEIKGSTPARAGGYGINLHGSANCTIVENAISGFDTGINLDASYNTIVAHNRIGSNSYRGIGLKACHSDKILDNLIEGNDNASCLVRMQDSVLCEIGRNILKNNAKVGILTYSSSDRSIDQNSFFKNTIMNNSIGILTWGSDGNVFVHNNLIYNVLQASMHISYGSAWNDSSEGNYWSDYLGKDGNNDAVGDTPYNIDNITRDSHPLMAESQDSVLQIDDIGYEIGVVCNSTILGRENELSFQLPNLEGSFFCRLCLPKTLVQPPFIIIQGPPYSRGDVIISSPIDYKVVKENQSHTWVYFIGRGWSGLTIAISTLSSPPLWYQSWFWAVCVSATVTLATIGGFVQQNRTKKSYKRELQNLRSTIHLKIAERLVEEDARRCDEILRELKDKYGVDIRPDKDPLDGLLKNIGIKKEEEQKC